MKKIIMITVLVLTGTALINAIELRDTSWRNSPNNDYTVVHNFTSEYCDNERGFIGTITTDGIEQPIVYLVRENVLYVRYLTRQFGSQEKFMTIEVRTLLGDAYLIIDGNHHSQVK